MVCLELLDIVEKEQFPETLIRDRDGEKISKLSQIPVIYLNLTKHNSCLVLGQDKHKSLLTVDF